MVAAGEPRQGQLVALRTRQKIVNGLPLLARFLDGQEVAHQAWLEAAIQLGREPRLVAQHPPAMPEFIQIAQFAIQRPPAEQPDLTAGKTGFDQAPMEYPDRLIGKGPRLAACLPTGLMQGHHAIEKRERLRGRRGLLKPERVTE
jgi:hypothetical protein